MSCTEPAFFGRFCSDTDSADTSPIDSMLIFQSRTKLFGDKHTASNSNSYSSIRHSSFSLRIAPPSSYSTSIGGTVPLADHNQWQRTLHRFKRRQLRHRYNCGPVQHRGLGQ